MRRIGHPACPCHVVCGLHIHSGPQARLEGTGMLWTIIVVLLVLWLLGLMLDLVGGLIHVLLVIALVVVVFRLLSGRRV
jgi:hypothetical protein